MKRYYWDDIEAQDFYTEPVEYVLRNREFVDCTVRLCANNRDGIYIAVDDRNESRYIIDACHRTDECEYDEYHDYISEMIRSSTEMFVFVCSTILVAERAYDDISEYTKDTNKRYLGESDIVGSAEIGNVRIEEVSYTHRTGYDGEIEIDSYAVTVSIGDIYTFSMAEIYKNQADNILSASRNIMQCMRDRKEHNIVVT